MISFTVVGRLAATQHGLISRAWLVGAGVSPSMIQRWLAAGRLQAVRRGVYRAAGAPETWEQRMLAAVLAAGPGAVASHRSAGRLWGILESDALDLSVPAGRRLQIDGVMIHRMADLAAASSVRRRGIPTTDPMRVLVDLGKVVGAAELEDALDRALERKLLGVEGVERAMERLARRGRTGVGLLRQVLDERALGTDRPDSLMEPRMARLLRAHGLPPAAFQHVVRDDGRFVAKVDFAYPAIRLAIEVDGRLAHASPRQFQRDLERQNELVTLGWTVIRFTWHDVVRRPAHVASVVKAAIESAAQGATEILWSSASRMRT